MQNIIEADNPPNLFYNKTNIILPIYDNTLSHICYAANIYGIKCFDIYDFAIKDNERKIFLLIVRFLFVLLQMQIVIIDS